MNSCGGGCGFTPAAGNPIPNPSRSVAREPLFAQRIIRTPIQTNSTKKRVDPTIHAKGTSGLIGNYPLRVTAKGYVAASFDCKYQMAKWSALKRLINY
jgi:hypothetical protein